MPEAVRRPAAWVDLAHEPSFRIGTLLVEPALRRIAHDDGREIILEPRVMQVFVALARAEGGILSHDDLVRCCWKAHFVSDDAVNRVLSSLRRTAGELGGGAFTIETLRKVGYRLVRSADASNGENAAPAPSSDPAGAHPSSPQSWLRSRIAAVPAATLVAALLALMVLYFGSDISGVSPRPTLISQGRILPRDQVLVADFVNRTHDPILGETVAEAISIDLSQSRLVRVVDDRTAAAALQRMEKPPTTPLLPPLALELAQREGIAAVVEGEISAVGPATLVTARLVSSRDGAVLSENHERADRPGELIEAVDKVSGALRAKIGESLAVLRAEPPLEQVTTSSLPALKLYTQAVNAIDRQGNNQKGMAFLEEALDLEPAFSTAWWKLGVALQRLQTQLGIQTQSAQMRRAFVNAYRHRHRLTERERAYMLAAYHRFVTFDMRKSAAALEAFLAEQPDDAAALRSLGAVHMVMGDFAAAAALASRALALDPKEPATYRHLMQHQANQGKFREAEATYRKAIKQFPTALGILEGGYYIAVARGDFALARIRVGQLRQTRSADPHVRALTAYYLGVIAAAEGRLAESERHHRESIETALSQSLAPIALRMTIHLADIELIRGRPAEGIRLLEQALSLHPLSKMEPSDRPYWELAEAYARLGDAVRARRFLALAEGEGLVEPLWSSGFRDRVAGLIALTEGKWPEAIARLRASLGGECAICSLYELGQAYQAAGQHSEALASYKRYVTTASVYRDEWLGPAYERLAVLSAQRRDRSKALFYAEMLARLWRNADADLKSRAHAAQRLAIRTAATAAIAPRRASA